MPVEWFFHGVEPGAASRGRHGGDVFAAAAEKSPVPPSVVSNLRSFCEVRGAASWHTGCALGVGVRQMNDSKRRSDSTGDIHADII